MEITFGQWIQVGVQRKWCSEIACQTHDGAPLNFLEEAAFEDGDDPCVPIVRIWGDEK